MNDDHLPFAFMARLLVGICEDPTVSRGDKIRVAIIALEAAYDLGPEEMRAFNSSTQTDEWKAGQGGMR